MEKVRTKAGRQKAGSKRRTARARTGADARARHARARRRAQAQALSNHLAPLLQGAHAFIAEMAYIPHLVIDEDESRVLAQALAKVIVSSRPQKHLEELAEKFEQHGPWMGLILTLGAIYGPRAFVLWNAIRAKKVKPSIVEMPAPAAPDPVAVN